MAIAGRLKNVSSGLIQLYHAVICSDSAPGFIVMQRNVWLRLARNTTVVRFNIVFTSGATKEDVSCPVQVSQPTKEWIFSLQKLHMHNLLQKATGRILYPPCCFWCMGGVEFVVCPSLLLRSVRPSAGIWIIPLLLE